MSTAEALARSSAKPAGKRPYFLAPETERVLAITMAAVQELAVARERIDTLERLPEEDVALSVMPQRVCNACRVLQGERP